jgi:ribonuclease BN (tRNA processing enzyme)
MSGPGSPASTYLVQATDDDGRVWSIVLDLGPGGLGRLMAHVDPREVDALFFSHLHPDHMADVTSLQVYLRYHPEGESGPLQTWGPEDTLERIGAVCWIDDRAELEGQFDVRRYETGRPVTVGPLRILPTRVRHPVPAFALRIEGPSETPGRTASIAYTGDTDSCPEVARSADGVDLLLSEASFQEGREDMVRGIHLTGRRAGELAAAAPGPEWDDGVAAAREAPDVPHRRLDAEMGPDPEAAPDPEMADGASVVADPEAAPDPDLATPGRRRPAGRLVLTHLPPWTDPDVVVAEARAVYAGPVEVATAGAVWQV